MRAPNTQKYIEAQLSRLRTPLYGVSSSDLNRPAATWIEPDLFYTEQIQALTIILKTQGCSWAQNHGGCIMCGYTKDSSPISPPPSALESQFAYALQKAQKAPVSVIKVFTSGSFFDENEIPLTTRQNMLKQLTKLPTLRNVIFETRPEYINQEILVDTKRILGDISLEIAIGLETSNDQIRETCIHKGFIYQNYVQAAKIIRSQNCSLRAYLLLKPPFLTEQEAIDDTIGSALAAVQDGATTISINPATVHNGTLLEQLWLQKWYRPPWLWSIHQILCEINEQLPPHVNVICHPVAGGKRRGPHNCGHCDKRLLQAIRAFSLSQTLDALNVLNCACKSQWEVIKQLEAVNHEPLLDELIKNP